MIGYSHIKCFIWLFIIIFIGIILKNNKEKINCPTCSKPNTWTSENTFKPFCSNRCKLIDLGEWASEARKIPSESVDALVDSM